MVWTNPMTFVANSALTAAQLNTFLRDNLNETAPAKATTAGRIFISTTDNTIVERPIAAAQVTSSQTTSSTTYTDLATAGPSVTVTTNQYAIVIFSLRMNNDGLDFVSANYLISGATTASHDPISEKILWATGPVRCTSVSWLSNLTPGSNTFKLQYKASVGTGTFSDRRLTVIAL